MDSQSVEPEHTTSTAKSSRDMNGATKTGKDEDLERLETTKEGEIQTQSPEAAKRHWIKTAPESPRNWPLWRKLSIVAGLNWYTFIVFICNTGFVTDQAEDHFGVNSESSVMGQSIVSGPLV